MKNEDFCAYLITGSGKEPAEYFGKKFNYFTEILYSSEGRVLKGKQKLNVIDKLSKNQNFVYLGDSFSDLPIWKNAKLPIFCGKNSLKYLLFKYLFNLKNLTKLSEKSSVLFN